MRAAAAPLAALLLGCVPKGRYLDLEASYDEAVAERDRAASERDACAADLRDATDARQAREGRVDDLVGAARKVVTSGAGEVVAGENGRLTLRLWSERLFAPDTADLTPEGAEVVAGVARLLEGRKEARFVVEGRTGAPPANTKEFPTAWHLGADRAIAVVQALVEAGVAPDRLVAGASAGPAPDRVEISW